MGTSIPCRDETRDRLREVRGDDFRSWDEFLLALADGYEDKPSADVETIPRSVAESGETVSLHQPGDSEPVQEIIDTIGAEVGGPQVDDSEIAREVARQIDYVELAGKVADELEARIYE